MNYFFYITYHKECFEFYLSIITCTTSNSCIIVNCTYVFQYGLFQQFEQRKKLFEELSYFYESSVFASNRYVLPVLPDNRNNSRNTLNRKQSQKCLIDDLFQNGFHSTAFKTRISSKTPEPSLYYYIQTYLEGEYGGGGWVCRVLTGNPGMTIGS